MKALISALVIGAFLGGCSRKTRVDGVNNPRDWFIESWDNGIFTFQHDGYTYKATCEEHTFSGKCQSAIGLVGHDVGTGKQKDADGWTILTVEQIGNLLILLRWRDDLTPLDEEQFNITSVTARH